MTEEANGLAAILGQDGVIVLIAGGVFIAVAAMLFFIAPSNNLEQRIRSVTALDGSGGGRKNRRTGALSMPSIEKLRDLSQKLNLLSAKQASSAADKLAQAGWRSHDAVVVFAFARALMPIAIGCFAALLVFFGNVTQQPMTIKLGMVVIAAIIGYALPGVFVKNMIGRRQAKLRKALPDALDLLVICSEAGLSLDAGISRVSREFANSSKELADELTLMSFELNFLPDRRMAFDALRRRVDLPAVHSLCSTLEQTEKFGTPLSQALRVLSAEQRQDRMMRAEEKAARLPAIMTVPLILFILPALVIVVMGPAMLKIIDAFAKM